MPRAATLFFGDPTRELDVAAITGTNGKTTTAFLLHAILEADGRRPGLLDEHRAARRRREPADRAQHARGDRPAAPLPRDGSTRATRACVMEATSIAQSQGRLDGHALRRARVHEPDAGPPRLPRLDGRVLRGEARAVRPGRAARSSTSATSTAGGSRAELPDAITFDADSDALDGIELQLPGRFNRENAIGAALAARALGVAGRRDPARDRVGRRRAGPLRADRRGAAVHRASSTTRTRRTRSRTCCARGRASWARDGSSSSSARAATATGRSGR